jgi:hypothetical protein
MLVLVRIPSLRLRGTVEGVCRDCYVGPVTLALRW